MFGRQRSGSVVCSSCGRLVGVNDERCLNCGRRNPGLFGFGPLLRRFGNDLGFLKLVIGGCAALYVAALAMDFGGVQFGSPFNFLSPSGPSLFLFGASGAVPVFGYQRWWTVLSAGWLHGSLLHLLFNVLWIRQLAPAAAELYGAGRTVVIYTVSSVCGFLASSFAGAFLGFLPGPLQGARLTVGASAAIFGLLGALIWYGRRAGSSALGQQAWTWAVVMFVFGFLGMATDNWAHAGGFLGGLASARLLDPLKPERGDHLLAAVVCLVLSAAAVAVSIAQGLGIVR